MDLNVKDLKPIIYNILTSLSNGNEAVKAAQNMDVQLSAAMKRDGVNIVQIQNVQLETVIPQLIDALKMIDQLEESTPLIIHENPLLENLNNRLTAIECQPTAAITYEPDEDVKPDIIDTFIAHVSDIGLDYRDIIDLIRVRMCEYLAYKKGGMDKAVNQMGVSKSSIYQSRRRLKERMEEDGDDTDQSGREDGVSGDSQE